MTGATCCSGIGAPECAAPEIEWLWAAEIDPSASRILAARHPGVPNLGDITAEDFIERATAYGRPDVLVAGTPCQGFSVAGLRRSLADERGNLTLKFLRIAHAVKPLALLWENVPGVFSTDDNAFGCFVAGLIESDEALSHGRISGGWPNAGVAAGPGGTACWRVLDAQYFGLAQRRQRVFLVFSPGDRCNPAEILFEWEGLRRDNPPRRQTGQSVTGTLAARTTAGGGLGDDFEVAGGLQPVGSFQNTGQGWWNESDVATTLRTPEGGGSGEANLISHALNAGGMGRQDYETETFVVGTMMASKTGSSAVNNQFAENGYVIPCEATHSLCAEYDASEDGTGRGIPLVTHALTQQCSAATEDGTGRGAPIVVSGGFYGNDSGEDFREELAPALRSMEEGGGNYPAVVTTTLTGNGDAHSGFKDGHGLVTTLAIRGRGEDSQLETRDDGLANAILTPNGGRGGVGVGAVAISENQQAELFETDYAKSLGGSGGKPGQGHQAVRSGMAVRRLTPRECERLQGFPDDYTLIPGISDGARYKALGNSMAVPVLRWLLRRIQEKL